ncbi:VanW family protein [Desulforamulus aquiferis]|uniref:VanW family protein n=1 Tax=Desulforamulus aquiferis TaxID=1397668 RepID=A0AAW7ZGZ5_9FIRM|nr:VanW family protein [Desulforamulus aquiferis]MDO7788701.1 VanW family protein [Desulforamulus aquiferis]
MPRKWRYFGFLAMPLIISLSLLLYLASGMSFASEDVVLPGISIMDVELSNLNQDQAVERVKQLEESYQKTIKVAYQNSNWDLPLNTIGLKLDCEKEVQRAMDIGRTGSLWQKFVERRQAHRGIRLEPSIQINPYLLEKTVSEVAKPIILPPRDAGLIINANDTIEVSPGSTGRLIDITHLGKDIKEILIAGEQRTIELKLVDVPPARSTEEVEEMGVDALLGSYTTQFDPSNVNRTYNVSVAAAALDGQIISPHEIFSFNDIVGPRSTEGGYKNAPIIVNNELVDGLGGGVCQVSTTLYNAVLLANLQLVERTNHSIPIPYVPIGRDATVVFDLIDFKFKNSTDYWLYIQSYVSGGNLTIKIFGNNSFRRDVVIRSWVDETYEPETIVEQDHSIRKGDRIVKQQGAPGYKALAERIVMQNGQVIKVEKLPFSIYNVKNKIISQGMALPSTIISTIAKDLDEEN